MPHPITPTIKDINRNNNRYFIQKHQKNALKARTIILNNGRPSRVELEHNHIGYVPHQRSTDCIISYKLRYKNTVNNTTFLSIKQSKKNRPYRRF